MKKALIASLAASALAIGSFAMTAVNANAATSYVFSNNLSVGSTGADVVALQSFLVSQGFLTMPAGVSMGYFGSITKAAVVAYQSSVGIVPDSGYVGPITRGQLNSGSSMAAAVNCPAGYTCTPPASTTTSTFVCPTGWTCTSPAGTPAGTPITGITTIGVAGSLVIGNGSAVGNGTSVNDGQSADIASFNLTAGASDEAVTSFSVDFSQRPWLYISSLAVRDQATGAVIATINGLSAASFTEITVGSDYRLTVPVSGVVIPAGVRKTVILSAQFAASNRTAVNIYISHVEVRAVDGTGVSTTQTLGDATNPTGLGLYVSYQGSSNSSLVVTLDGSSPASAIVQTSASSVTNSIPLSVYSFKSQNISSTLQSLILNVSTASSTGPVDPTTVFQNITLKSGSTVLANGTFGTVVNGTVPVTFNNFSLALPQDQYIPVQVIAAVQKNINGITASTTLTPNTTNVQGIDANSNPLTLNSGAAISGAIATFSTAGANISGESFTIVQPGGNNTGTYKSASFNGSFTLTAGSNPIYVNRTAATAFGVTKSNSASTSVTFSNLTVGNGVQSYDPSGWYEVIPGSSRTFSFNGSFLNTGASSLTSVTFGINQVNFSSDAVNEDNSITTGLDGLNAYFGGNFVTLGTQTQ
jgi:hypothetical protein